jgi:L-seryl-tRNA(Ser) seleniumtransferase
MIGAIKRNQLTRALRIDKLTLLALEETLKIYRDEKDAFENIPTLKMISMDNNNLKRKALRLYRTIGKLKTDAFTIDRVIGSSRVGGGALPLFELPTILLRLTPGRMSANSMENLLKQSDPPIIVRVEQDKVLLDVRTIQEKELRTVAEAIRDLAK